MPPHTSRVIHLEDLEDEVTSLRRRLRAAEQRLSSAMTASGLGLLPQMRQQLEDHHAALGTQRAAIRAAADHLASLVGCVVVEAPGTKPLAPPAPHPLHPHDPGCDRPEAFWDAWWSQHGPTRVRSADVLPLAWEHLPATLGAVRADRASRRLTAYLKAAGRHFYVRGSRLSLTRIRIDRNRPWRWGLRRFGGGV